MCDMSSKHNTKSNASRTRVAAYMMIIMMMMMMMVMIMMIIGV